MPAPLSIGTSVIVLTAPPIDGEPWARSEPTTIVAVLWVNPGGEVVDTEQEDWQYLLDAEEPFPDIAVRPEHVEVA